MAHPSRAHFVEELRVRLDDAPVTWDEKNDRWDTGRRALLTYDPRCDWHLVVQDDALLCKDFLDGVKNALATVKRKCPVSFYTGKTRPYAREMSRYVTEATLLDMHWLEMRGPLWGVALALPSSMIHELVSDVEEWEIPNYDIRMSEWFHRRGINCLYTLPSLADHRVGPQNPSLVPGRGSTLGRTAHCFLGPVSAKEISWNTPYYNPGDPSMWWNDEDWSCTRCAHRSEDLPEAISHAFEKHNLGAVDFVATTPHHARTIDSLYKALRADVRGRVYVVGPTTGQHLTTPHTRLRRGSARAKLQGAGDGFVVCGALRDLKLIGNRSGWSLDGYGN
jgi:hypothetical protein